MTDHNKKRLRETMAFFDKMVLLIVILSLLVLPIIYLYISDNPNDIKELFLSIITNVIPTSLIFVMSYITLRFIQTIRSDMERDDLVGMISDVFRTHSSENNSLKEDGIIRSYKSLPLTEINNLINQSRGEVKLMTTWSGFLVQSNEFFAQCQKNNVKMQILLLNPSHHFVTERGIGLYNNPDTVRNYINTCIEEIKKFSTDYNIHTEVRLYDFTPPFRIYIFGDRAIIGFLWHNDRSTARTQIEVDLGSKFFGTHVANEYASAWVRGEEIWKSEVAMLAEKKVSS